MTKNISIAVLAAVISSTNLLARSFSYKVIYPDPVKQKPLSNEIKTARKVELSDSGWTCHIKKGTEGMNSGKDIVESATLTCSKGKDKIENSLFCSNLVPTAASNFHITETEKDVDRTHIIVISCAP